jgi:Kef-type K+ transport system membrane component KefB
MSNLQLSIQFLLQLAVILAACRVVGLIARRLGQAQVVAEMVTGFLLGPSLFGWMAPDLSAQLFPKATMPVLYVVSQLALTLYMFKTGLEFNVDSVRREFRRAASVSIAGVAFPFALGAALAWPLFQAGGFFGAGLSVTHAALFVGAAMSITAFPVLARIIHERGLTGTALGSLALAAGATDDAAAWLILAIVVGSVSGNMTIAMIAAGGMLGYVATVLLLRRPVLGRLANQAEEDGKVSHSVLASALLLLMLGAVFTDVVGVHAVFGAFVLGAAMPRGVLARELERTVGPLTTTLLLPLFFVYSGLNTRLSLVNTPWLWMVAAAIFVAACVGKGLACWLAARLSGADNRDALGLGTLMNARGLMELVLLNIGLERGLITPTLFTMLVLMALGTTLMTYPLFGLVYRRGAERAADDRELAATSRM